MSLTQKPPYLAAVRLPFAGALAALIAGVMAVASPAVAQVASVPYTTQAVPGWQFSVTPYIWMPTLSANLQATGPRGGVLTSNVSAGIGDYISDLNFAAMGGAVARNDRFSILTDIIYMNASLTTSTTHLGTVNLGPGPVDIPRDQQLSTGTRMGNTVWSLAAGYTIADGPWGNLDVVGGLRMLSISATANYLLTGDFSTPDGTLALSRTGGATINKTYFNGIGGATGRINIPDSKFYLPYYIDAGAGGVAFTWQIYGGIAYSATSWADLSLGYRYLTFQDGGSTGVHTLSTNGVLLAANFRF
jgi:hypothetical protein